MTTYFIVFHALQVELMQEKLQFCYLLWVQIKFVVRGSITTAETNKTALCGKGLLGNIISCGCWKKKIKKIHNNPEGLSLERR